MNIPPHQARKAWRAPVVAARCLSRQALISAVAGLQARHAIEDGWTKPLIDKALAGGRRLRG